MSQGIWVLLVALALATVFGSWRAARDGRFRGTHRLRVPGQPRSGQPRPEHTAPEPSVPGRSAADRLVPDRGPAVVAQSPGPGVAEPRRDPEPDRPQAALDLGPDLSESLGERGTLLQFSSAFCAPCRVTRRVLAEVTATVPGVAHVEVDAESHLDLVRRLGVSRTPTTLLLDGDGRELSRASGAPTKDAVVSLLARVLPG